MKILAVSPLPPPFGGMQVLAKSLACSLARQGAEVAVVTHRTSDFQPANGMPNQRVRFLLEQHNELTEQGVRIYPTFHRRAGGDPPLEQQGAGDQAFAEQFQLILQNQRPEIVHCHWGSRKTQQIVRVARKLGIPSIVSIHGISDLVGQSDVHATDGMSAAAILRLLKHTSHIIAVSREAYDYCHGHGLQTVSHIYGGVSTDYFRPNAKAVRRGYLYVGKNRRHKCIGETCEAFLKIVNQVDDDLHLVGRGTTADAFKNNGFFLDEPQQRQFDQLMQLGRVKLWGELWPDQLRGLYQGSKALVLPSLTEGFPLAILESLSCATPVIASDVGSVSDIVRCGHNGYLIPKADSQALAQAMLEINDTAGAELYARCRSSVGPYDIERIAGQHLQLFKRLLTETRTTRHLRNEPKEPAWRASEASKSN